MATLSRSQDDSWDIAKEFSFKHYQIVALVKQKLIIKDSQLGNPHCAHLIVLFIYFLC